VGALAAGAGVAGLGAGVGVLAAGAGVAGLAAGAAGAAGAASFLGSALGASAPGLLSLAAMAKKGMLHETLFSQTPHSTTRTFVFSRSWILSFPQMKGF
jgi:hypothetical protein